MLLLKRIHIQISLYNALWMTVLLLSACGGKSSTVSGSAQGDSIPLHYSSNLSLIDYEDYIVAVQRCNLRTKITSLHSYAIPGIQQRYYTPMY